MFSLISLLNLSISLSIYDIASRFLLFLDSIRSSVTPVRDTKMLGSFLSRALLMVFGYAYPAYECFKIVKKNNPEIHDQLLSWCHYWILVAMLTVSERIGDFFFSWLPLYSEAKLALFIYLWSSKMKGTKYIYSCFFQPFMARHEAEIDRRIWELRTKAGNFVIINWKKALSIGQARFLEILQSVSSPESAITSQPHYPHQSDKRNKLVVPGRNKEACEELLTCDTELEPISEEADTYVENEDIIKSNVSERKSVDKEAVHVMPGKWKRMFSSAGNTS